VKKKSNVFMYCLYHFRLGSKQCQVKSRKKKFEMPLIFVLSMLDVFGNLMLMFNSISVPLFTVFLSKYSKGNPCCGMILLI
jgi:hypothetical protein